MRCWQGFQPFCHPSKLPQPGQEGSGPGWGAYHHQHRLLTGLGKMIGTRYPLAVEAQLAAMTPAERSAFIRRWVAYGLRAEAEE